MVRDILTSVSLVVLMFVIFPVILMYFGEWILALMSILSGDKELLKDCHLCEKDNYKEYPNPIDWNKRDMK